MDQKIIQKRVNDIAEAMLAKGMRAPGATVMLKANAEPCIYMSWADHNKTYGESYDSFSAPTLVGAFEAATKFIASRPSPEQARLNEFMGALGKVIDMGRDTGIEVDFLNPLVATMKKLSENIITDQRAA